MNTDKHGSHDAAGLKCSAVTARIIGVFFDVYNELGSGFLESVYVEALALAFGQAGLSVQRETPLAVTFRGNIIGRFRADLIVAGAVLVEAKSCPKLHSSHEAQLLNYLRATVLEIGLLLNFGPRPQFRRFLFDNMRKNHRQQLSRPLADAACPAPGIIRAHRCSSVAL